MTPSELPAPIRRIAAYFIDCGLVIVYLGLLTAVARVLEGLGGPNLFDVGSALAFQGTVFMMLVLPAWMYLAWCESSAWQAVLSTPTFCTFVREFSPQSPFIAQNSSSNLLGLRLVSLVGSC